MNKLDITGQRFGKLVAIRPQRARDGAWAWLCKCDCGNTAIVRTSHLRTGMNVSCGCFGKTVRITHGLSYSPEWAVYHAAKARCENPNSKSFTNYGGRGIEFRFKSLSKFISVIGRRPTAQHSLDRIDNNGHYEAGNVRWASRLEQLANRRICKPCREAMERFTPNLEALNEFYQVERECDARNV